MSYSVFTLFEVAVDEVEAEDVGEGGGVAGVMVKVMSMLEGSLMDLVMERGEGPGRE
jgi:hypothetical protein